MYLRNPFILVKKKTISAHKYLEKFKVIEKKILNICFGFLPLK